MASKRKKTGKGASSGKSKPKAKARAKAAASGTRKAETGRENPDGARRVISGAALKDLARLSDQCYSRAQAASGQIGQAVRDYQERGLDPIAFRIVMRLRRMGQNDPIKLRSVRDNIEYYADALGLDDLTAKDMFKDEGKEKPRSRKKGTKSTQLDLSERSDVVTNGDLGSGGNGTEAMGDEPVDGEPAALH